MNKKPNLFNQVVISSIEDYKNKIKTLTKQKERLIRRDKRHREEIERLNKELNKKDTIIKGMEKFFQYAYDNEVKPLNDRKISVWTICLDKLQELKDGDKE